MKSKKLSIYADGGSRGNPGPSGIGIVIKEGRKKIKEVFKFIGETTNNVAEYNALIIALEEARTLGATEILINLDSELIVKQLNGEYKVKDVMMKELFEKALQSLREFDNFEICHIEREMNKEADKLVNKAINLASLFR